MKKNLGMLGRRNTRCVRGRKQVNVDTQPAAEAAVSGDPRGEGFDFGPHVVLFCTQTQQLRHGLDAAWFTGKRVSEEHGGFCLAF